MAITVPDVNLRGGVVPVVVGRVNVAPEVPNVKFPASVVVPLAFPIPIAVAAPKAFTVVEPVLKSVTVPDAVVNVGVVPKVTVGVAAPSVIAVAFGNVTVAFLMLPVPVVAPIVSVVAAPPTCTVSALVLNTDAVPVEDVTIDGETPLMFKTVAFVRVTVGFRIDAVPPLAPRASVVDAFPPTTNAAAVPEIT